MANDLHIFLSEEEFAQIRAIAKREDRSVSNLARVYIRRALAADSLDDAPISATKALEVLLGRSTLTPLVEDCVTTDEPGLVPKHDLAAQVRTLGADSLLPDPRMTVTPSHEPEVTPRFKAGKGRP